MADSKKLTSVGGSTVDRLVSVAVKESFELVVVAVYAQILEDTLAVGTNTDSRAKVVLIAADWLSFQTVTQIETLDCRVPG